jgi:integrase
VAYTKGEKVERGIWIVKGYERKQSKLYWSEVWLKDPKTGKRLKQSKVSNRLDVVRDWWHNRKNAQTSGELAKERAQKHITFTLLADEYFADWGAKRKESTVRTEKNRIDGILKPYFGKKNITTVTRKDIEEFIRKRREGSLDDVVAQGRRNTKQGGVTIATTNRDLCRLKNIFKKAVEWGFLEFNPAIGIPQEKEEVPETFYLERDEVAKLFECAEVEYLPIFKTAVFTGLRFGELMKLEWRDVNWEFNTLHVRKPKNNEDRYVPMNDAVKVVLGELGTREESLQADLRDSRGYVFVNPNTGKPFNDVRKGLKRALDKAKVTKHIRFHDLRHTTGSHLAMNGSTEVEIAEFLGHKDTTVTRRYTHLSKTHMQAVANRLSFEAEPRSAEMAR